MVQNEIRVCEPDELFGNNAGGLVRMPRDLVAWSKGWLMVVRLVGVDDAAVRVENIVVELAGYEG